MSLRTCPKSEKLLEYVSCASEMPFSRRTGFRAHLAICGGCRERVTRLQSTWSNLLEPEPELTPSLLKVYGRLKTDETLILKGWKLEEVTHERSISRRIFSEGWFFRGSVAVTGLAAGIFLIRTQMYPAVTPAPTAPTEMVRVSAESRPPVAQIRIEKKNRVQVHYVQPELIESMEFETASFHQ